MHSPLDPIQGRPKYASLVAIFGVAALIRGAFLLILPVRYGGDSHLYVSIAQGISAGDFSLLSQFPLHVAYPLLLIPGAALQGIFTAYVAVLHIVLSALTVVLLYLISRELTPDGRVHIATAGLALVYPGFLAWLPYVLTETQFFFALALFAYLLLITLKMPTLKTYCALTLVAIWLFFSRPVSLIVLGVAFLLIVSVRAYRRYSTRWWMITGTTVIVGVGLLTMGFSIPSVANRILALPTVAESLWLSTRVTSGNIEEYFNNRHLPAEMAIPGYTEYQSKASRALDFIQTHPLQYVGMAARRFIYYFYPWLYDNWSVRHRVADALFSIGITMAVLVAQFSPADRLNRLTLCLLALAFGVLIAFSQIDSDARYRMSAEVLFLPVASLGVVNLVTFRLTPLISKSRGGRESK